MSDQKLYATLVVGNTYVLNGKFFQSGKPLEVTVDEMRHLKKHAVIRNKSTNGKVFLEPQFSFEKMNEDDVFTDEDEDELEDEGDDEQDEIVVSAKKQKSKKNPRPAVKKRQTDDVTIND